MAQRPKALDKKFSEALRVMATPADAEAFKKAADECDLPFSEWARDVLQREAARVLEAAPKKPAKKR